MKTLGVSLLLLLGAWLWLWRKARFPHLPAAPRPHSQRAEGSVCGVSFSARDGTRLDGWLFLPHGARPAPVVLMAPGLGGTKDGFLEPYAWRFAARGIAALVFDFRCFGGSDGLPRHWVDPTRHQQDYEAALAFVRGELAASGQIDPERIALWGSSFSAGSALMVATRQANVRALVVQCPYLKTPPSLEPRGLSLLRFVLWAMLDLLRIFPPIYVPMFGRPGEWVFAPSQENPSVHDFTGPLGASFWRELPQPGLGGWDNRMLARVLPTLNAFTPLDHVGALHCPVLFVAAQRDDLVPLQYVRDAHARASSSIRELHELDAHHFGLYVGALGELNAERQAEFLARHLAQPTTPPS